MKPFNKYRSILLLAIIPLLSALGQYPRIDVKKMPYLIYPELNKNKPDLPSPFVSYEDDEYVISVTSVGQFTITEVTPSNEGKICKQLIVDTPDFPQLYKSGLHSEARLNQLKTITGRPLERITELGRPGGLSFDGFMAKDENIIAVMKGDNRVVKKLGLKHPQLARPLFHVLNMMNIDLEINRWNMAKHRWDNIQSFFYNDQTVFVEAQDSKGGQESIFNDQLEGAFYIKLWRNFESDELAFLDKKYGHLSEEKLDTLKTLLSSMQTGEMEPQYILRYGFYEGHTFWRTDPIAISFIFGFKSLKELESIFDGNLYKVLTDHYLE